MNVFFECWADESGATAIEYALIASVISIAIIGALIAVSDGQTGLFAHLRTEVVPALGGELPE